MASPFAIPGAPFGGAPQLPRAPSVHTARSAHSPISARSTSTRGTRDRHGSLEQITDVFGRPTLARPAFMPRPTTPRRERSPDDERESRERNRQDWRGRRDPSTPGDQPQGFGSRLLQVENHIKETVTEINSAKGMMEQVKSTVDQLGSLSRTSRRRRST